MKMQSFFDNLARPLLLGSHNKSQAPGTIPAPYESYPTALKIALQRADCQLDHLPSYLIPRGPPESTPVCAIIHQQFLLPSCAKSTIWSIHKSARTANTALAAHFVTKCPEVLFDWPTAPWECKGSDICVYDELSEGEDMHHLFNILSGEDRDFSGKDWESLSPGSSRGVGEDSAWSMEDEDGVEEESCPCRKRGKEVQWEWVFEGLVGGGGGREEGGGG